MNAPVIAVLVFYILFLSTVFYFLNRPLKPKHPIYKVGEKVWLLGRYEAVASVVVGFGRDKYLVSTYGSTYSADVVPFRVANKRLLRREGE